jgi:chromosome segregation ATPase
MARKDIEIRVKTSGADKASRNAKKIADELNRLGTGGSSASSGIKKSSDAFAKMAGDVAKVSAEVSTIEKLGTAISKLDKAGADLNRLGDNLDSAAKGFASVRAETQQYAQQSAQLKKNIAAEEAAIAARNDDLKTAKAALNENKKATIALADAQAVLNGKTRKSTSASANVASKGVGIESGAPLSSARDSFAAFLAADMSVLEGADAQIKASVAAIRESIQASKTAIDTLSTELRIKISKIFVKILKIE